MQENKTIADERLRRAWTCAVVIAPLAVIFFAAWIFNNVIEYDRINFKFLSGTVRYVFSDGLDDKSKYMNFIPSSVILSIYNFGFAACVMSVISVASSVYALAAVWRYITNRGVRLLMSLVVIVASLVVGYLYYSRVDLPAPIARELIKETLYYLPACERTLLVSCREAVGNTGNSLLRVVGIMMTIASAAGFAFWMAVIAIVAANAQEDPETKETDGRRGTLQSATILVATAFLMTVVATHLLFQPGADLIVAAYTADGAGEKFPAIGKAALTDFTNLRNAMTLYWGTVFSLALSAAYFPAEAAIATSEGKALDFGGVWTRVKSVVTVILPLIASGVLQVAQEFLKVLDK